MVLDGNKDQGMESRSFPHVSPQFSMGCTTKKSSFLQVLMHRAQENEKEKQEWLRILEQNCEKD